MDQKEKKSPSIRRMGNFSDGNIFTDWNKRNGSWNVDTLTVSSSHEKCLSSSCGNKRKETH